MEHFPFQAQSPSEELDNVVRTNNLGNPKGARDVLTMEGKMQKCAQAGEVLSIACTMMISIFVFILIYVLVFM